MAESKAGNKGLSIALLVIGAAMMGYALVLDFSGSSAAFRGPLLVVGAVWQVCTISRLLSITAQSSILFSCSRCCSHSP